MSKVERRTFARLPHNYPYRTTDQTTINKRPCEPLVSLFPPYAITTQPDSHTDCRWIFTLIAALHRSVACECSMILAMATRATARVAMSFALWPCAGENGNCLVDSVSVACITKQSRRSGFTECRGILLTSRQQKARK
jgi:hypothetical protein